jgi:hypothetical protein
MDRIRNVFRRSTRKSGRAVSSQVQIPRLTVHNFQQKHLHPRAYKIQLLQALKPNDRVQLTVFSVDKLETTEATRDLPMILGFRRVVNEICAVLGYYAASTGNSLPTFRDKVSILSSRVKKSKSFLLGLLDP